MGGKGRGEIRGESGKVNRVVANAPTTDGFGKRYGTFNGWGATAGKLEVLLVLYKDLGLSLHNFKSIKYRFYLISNVCF